MQLEAGARGGRKEVRASHVMDAQSWGGKEGEAATLA